LVQGFWFKVFGSRFLVQGFWFKVFGSRFLVQGFWFKVFGSRFTFVGLVKSKFTAYGWYMLRQAQHERIFNNLDC